MQHTHFGKCNELYIYSQNHSKSSLSRKEEQESDIPSSPKL